MLIIRIFGSTQKAKEPGCISVEFQEGCIEQNKLLPWKDFELQHEAHYFSLGLTSTSRRPLRSRPSDTVKLDNGEDVTVVTTKKVSGVVKNEKITKFDKLVEPESDGEPMVKVY